jgi:hypothetical protein
VPEAPALQPTQQYNPAVTLWLASENALGENALVPPHVLFDVLLPQTAIASRYQRVPVFQQF